MIIKFEHKDGNFSNFRSKLSKVCHSRKPSKEKALNFTVGIKNTPPNYSFMPKNCFELPLWTKLLSDTSPNKIYLASIDSHY